jgi:hypothetical protein
MRVRAAALILMTAVVTGRVFAGETPASNQPAMSFVIRPGVQWGPLRQTTTRAQLPALLPRDSMRDADFVLGEGFCVPGTRIFPGTDDEIEVAWQDAARSRIAFVRTVSSLRNRWITARGVRIGTLLTELERDAGHPLTFLGFGWDYGGGMKWSEPSGELQLRLAVDPADVSKSIAAPDADSIKGDRLIRSDLPPIRQLRIHVAWMQQSWGDHFGEHDCAATGPR